MTAVRAGMAEQLGASQPPIRVHDSWAHQLIGYDFAMEHEASMLAMGMGTGKSKVAIDVVANEAPARVLILCPKSVVGVWRREFQRHWPAECSGEIYLLDRHSTKEKADELAAFLRSSEAQTKIVVVNYDSAWRLPLADALLQAKFDFAILDESHRIKAPGGKASRWAQKLGRVVRRRLCLTGTPMPHSPLDLYGQFRFLKPDVFGTSFTRFRARYAVTNPMFPSQVKKWINQEDLQIRFHANAFVCNSDEVLDLPEVTHQTRPVELSPKTMRVYRQLEKNLMAEVDAGTVTVANALTKLLRLQQCTSGFVGGRDENDAAFIESLGNEKEVVLGDLLEDVDRPAIVFCRFTRDLDAVERVAGRLGRTYGELSGRRRDLTDHAEMPEGVQVMAVQIQSGGVGIDLTRASYGIYYSLGYSLGEYLQSLARLHRPGQDHCVHFYALVASGTVDEAVYKALDSRAEVVGSVLQAMRGSA